MAGKAATSNTLISNKTTDTPVTVQLHPLVLLTVSDYITRHTLRSQKGPVVGAIIGQQNGRSFTLEHAFECKLADSGSSEVQLDAEWFTERIEQYRDVHKAPALDLVALFTLGPAEGPQAAHLPVLKQVQQLVGNDNIMLLLFQPEMVDKMEGGKLPIGLYEPFQEPVGEQTEMRFRELSFEVETGEAEMIGVDFVAKGGGNATAVPGGQSNAAGEASQKEKKGKGKGKAKDEKTEEEADGALSNVLSAEDEELIASLTAKANAIKMLNQRINLIRSYLTSLPTSYLTDASSEATPADTTNHPLLRNINSLLSRLPLLAPPTVSEPQQTTINAQPTSSPLQAANTREQSDVHLTSLLAALTRSVSEAQTMASRYSSVTRERTAKERSFGGGSKMLPPELLDAGGF